MKRPVAGPSAEDMRRIDLICDEFEDRLKQGLRPTIEDNLEYVDAQLRPSLLEQLLVLELEYLRPCTHEYEVRFANYVSVLEAVLAASRDTDTMGSSTSLNLTNMDAEDGRFEGKLLGHYRLGKLLGSGGMGAVYEATNELLDNSQLYAIKIVRTAMAENEEAIDRFRQEAQAISGFQHTNIVVLKHFGSDDGVFYLVMDLLEGEDLDSRTKRLGWLDIVEAIDVCRQTAEGLSYAHKHRRIHRDIKPKNLFRVDDGSCQILDFGLVRVLGTTEALDPLDSANGPSDYGQITQPGSKFGTYGYASPEQLNDPRQADQRSDIYSLGCTLYYFVTGRHAFEAKTRTEMQTAILNGSFPSPSSIRPEIPRVLNDYVERMMSRDPSDRPDSATEVGQTLGRIGRWWGDCVNEKQQLSHVTRFAWLRNHPWAVLILAGILASLLMIGVNENFNVHILYGGMAPDQHNLARLYINIIGHFLGVFIGMVFAWPLVTSIRQVQLEGCIDTVAFHKARNRCLRLGTFVGILNLILWSCAGLSYPILLYWFHYEQLNFSLTWNLIASLASYGLLVAMAAYLLVNFIAVRAVYPMLLSVSVSDPREVPIIDSELGITKIVEKSAAVVWIPFITWVLSSGNATLGQKVLVFRLIGVVGTVIILAITLAPRSRQALAKLREIISGQTASAF